LISVSIICIGKIKEAFFRDAVLEYQKRLSRYCDFTIRELSEVSLSENPSNAEIDICLEKESEAILKEIPRDAYVFALCIEGKGISSEELSEKIESLAVSGKSKIVFIIGSSFGLNQKIKQRADFKLSFSKMTFPHQLFRVLLTEQIYRAFTIINKAKYHK
jgi:23S rRNA (pseudouridine1915-N3)-methyltransferase